MGNVFLGAAVWRSRGLARVVAVLFFCAAGLTLFNLSGEFSGPVLPPGLDTWLYPALQPPARLLIRTLSLAHGGRHPAAAPL